MPRRAAGLDLDAVLAEAFRTGPDRTGPDPTATGRARPGHSPARRRASPAGPDETRRPSQSMPRPPAQPAQDPDGEAMLDATIALLGSYGLRRWSMDDVAARAGLARATVYRRFDNRDRLVRAALIRDARRLFAAIAAAVHEAGSVEEKVVEGFVVGIQLARLSPVPTLLATDPSAALALVSSEFLLAAGRRALVESYETLIGNPVPASDRPEVEAVAEALIRLALSLMVTPGLLTGSDGGQPDADPDAMRRSLAVVIGPLVAPARPLARPVRRRSRPPR